MRRVMGTNRSAAGRQAGWLFVVAGLIGLVDDVRPGVDPQAVAILLDLLVVVVGATIVRLPWRRWPVRWTLVLPLLALTNLGVNLSQDLLPASTIGVWLVLVFVWVGQWHAPRTALLLGPAAALALTVPLLLGASASGDVIPAVVVSVPVAVLVGETIARKEAATRVAQAALAVASLTDDLTGLGNRRRADALLDSLAAGDALAILDLDHFKLVNDTYGHERGDEVLHDLGLFLADAIRGIDLVARFGGEEFVVVLRDAGSSAPATIERLLEGWRRTGPLATLSAGIAVHGDGRSAHDTFADADAALYAAKAGGRDRFVTAG
jgi:diguanylate cyclase (GGDEF)-like protein